MQIDLNHPQFTQKQATEITSADLKTIDNYIQHRQVEPHRLEGRRLFSALQLIQIDLIARMADIFRIPPKTGAVLAQRFLKHPSIAEDAQTVGDQRWAHQAHKRAEATIRRLPGGEVEVVMDGENDPEAILMVVPVQMFARLVMAKAATLMVDD